MFNDKRQLFYQKISELLTGNKQLMDEIIENKEPHLLSNNKQIEYLFNNKGFKIIYAPSNGDFMRAENFTNCADQVAQEIGNEIKQLHNNATKKIAVYCNNGDHCVGMVIGKTNEGKSYIFLDRENFSGRYLGGSIGGGNFLDISLPN